jgi:hypothetical protein
MSNCAWIGVSLQGSPCRQKPRLLPAAKVSAGLELPLKAPQATFSQWTIEREHLLLNV